MKNRVIILCGGSGTRLWPESRKNFPKQFIPISNGQSLFDKTLERVKKIENCLKPIIVTNEKYKFLVRDSLSNQNLDATIILEPIAKNTAPSIYIASKIINKNENIIIFPSDHYIKNNSAFINTINKTLKENIYSKWITFGVTPDYPATSFGYIKIKNYLKKKSMYNVVKFIEKPNSKDAKLLLDSKDNLWNSGILIVNTEIVIQSIQEKAPLISKYCDSVLDKKTYSKTKDEYVFDLDLFKKIPSISIDNSVLEKISNIDCCPINCGWNDIGSWDGFFKSFPGKYNSKNIVQVNSKNNSIKSKDRLITALGVKDLIVVDNNDAILIAKKGLYEDFKQLISVLEKRAFPQLEENIFENRPWGKFENILINKNLKIKKILVNPKSKLSKQFHHFRSEHWFITKGKGFVFKDGKIQEIKKGQSIDIPKKCIHFIENRSEKKLIFIEIQMGTYLGEDDIIRLDDIYGRK